MSKIAVDRQADQVKATEKQSYTPQKEPHGSTVPSLFPSHPLLGMQATMGNQAVVQMMQGDVFQSGRNPSGGPGQSLSGQVKEKMESSFGADFSNVQIHKDSSLASSIGARAFAQGEQIHFSPGQFSPDSQGGQELLGHELAHVVQQREGQTDMPQGKGTVINVDQGLEKSADLAGSRAAKGLPAEHAKSSRQSADLSSAPLSSTAHQSAATNAPVQASFFKSILGGLKQAGQGFMESGGMQSLMSAGMSAGKSLLGGGSFGDALKAGGSSFMQSGGMGQLSGAAMSGASSFATESGLVDKVSPFLAQAQPYAQKAVDSGATDFIGGKISGFGSSMEQEGGLKGLLGKGLGFAGNLLGGLGKKKK